MAADPRISAIMAVYNGERYIRKAVESIVAQTLPPCELILVDDGSTDGSMAAVADMKAPFPIRRLSQANAGQSAARNRGAREAVGEYIALCDQDDTWFPRHLQMLYKPFRRLDDGRLAWTYSNWSEVDADGRTISMGYLDGLPLEQPKRNLGHLLGAGVIIQPGAALIKRAAFDAVGGFDPKLSGYEDDDLFLRMFCAGWENHFVPVSLSTWRIYWSSSQFKPRTRESRRYYARKLMDAFPDDPGGMRYWVRDCLAPRFCHIVLQEYERALSFKEWDLARELAWEALSYASLTDLTHVGRKDRCWMRLRANPRWFKSIRERYTAMPSLLRRLLPLRGL